MEDNTEKPKTKDDGALNDIIIAEFAKKFNTTYGGLSENQKNLIKVCITKLLINY